MKRILLLAITIAAGVAINGAAFAGATISDKRYWPNEAQSDTSYKAFASGKKAPASQAKQRVRTDQYRDQGQKSCRYLYQGGPKSGSVAC